MSQAPMILYIGRDRAQQQIMSRILRHSGYRMTSTYNSDAAVAACRNREFVTAVLLDESAVRAEAGVAESIAGVSDVPIVLLSRKGACQTTRPRGIYAESDSPLGAVDCLKRALGSEASN